MRIVIIFLWLTFVLALLNCSSQRKVGSDYPDCSSTDISKMDTCLLGMTLRQATNKLKVATSRFSLIEEPLLMLNGISYMTNDSSDIELFVQKTSILKQRDSLERSKWYLFIFDKPIISVSWTKDAGTTYKTVYAHKKE
jgi:hypothetical protein